MGEINKLTGQVAALSAATAPAAATSSPLKAPKMACFSGEHSVDGQDVEVWAFSADNFFNLAGATNDGQRIAYAVARLEKTALQWWQYQVLAAARGGAPLPTTWQQFVAALIARFQPINAERAARDRLMSITQSGSVAAYASTFQKLLMRVTDLPAAQVLHFFVHGLQPAVKRELLFRPPPDLATAIIDAERVASVLAQTQPRAGNTGCLLAAPARSGPTPMELGAALDEDAEFDPFTDELAAVRAPPPRRPASTGRSSAAGTPLSKLTPEQRRHCMANNLCLRCRKPGHRAADCIGNNQGANPKGGRPPRAGVTMLEQE